MSLLQITGDVKAWTWRYLMGNKRTERFIIIASCATFQFEWDKFIFISSCHFNFRTQANTCVCMWHGVSPTNTVRQLRQSRNEHGHKQKRNPHPHNSIDSKNLSPLTRNCVFALRLAMARCKPNANIKISLNCVTNSHFICWHVLVCASCSPSSAAVWMRSIDEAVNADI